MNLGPLGEQLVHVTAKPSLQSLYKIFKILKNLKSFKLVLSCGCCPDTGAGSGGSGPRAYFESFHAAMADPREGPGQHTRKAAG